MKNTPVLVAEDQTFVALDLAFAIEDAGGVVVGPAASAAVALDLLATKTVAAAILDVDLADGDCSPVLEVLTRRHIPTIVQTGMKLPAALAARFPGLIVQSKPFVASALVSRLEALIDQAEVSRVCLAQEEPIAFAQVGSEEDGNKPGGGI